MARCYFLVGFLLLMSFGCKSAVEKQLIEVARLNELQNKVKEFIEHNTLRIAEEKVALQKCEKPFFDEVSQVSEQMSKALVADLMATRNSAEDNQLKDRMVKERDMKKAMKNLATTLAQIYCQDIYVKIARLKEDLKMSSATYDSIHALHTDAVIVLSKLRSDL